MDLIFFFFTILILISISNVSTLTTGGGGEKFQSHVLPVQRKFSGVSTDHDRRRHHASAVDLPLGHHERIIGLYYTKVNIGSPAEDYYPFVDTGSDLFWIKCNQKGFYYPEKSRTARTLQCEDELCITGCKKSPSCSYETSYADGSHSNGYMVSDQLHLDTVSGNYTTLVVNTTLVFGCGVRQTGHFIEPLPVSDGIVGLGRSNLSLVSQLANIGISRRSFGHCLAAESDGGIFVIGRVDHPKVKRTPMTKNRPHYIVNMLSIAFDTHTLQLGKINGVETAIDCGSTLSYLPADIYEVIVTQILSKLHESTPFLINNLHCFQYNRSVDDRFPTISLRFEDSLELVIYPREYLFYLQVNQYCLGLRNSGSLTNDLKNMAFLGDNVLSHKFVLYDIENESIGWTPYDCFSSVGVKGGNSTTVYEVAPRHVYASLRQTSAARSRDIKSVMIFLASLLSLLLTLKFR